MRRERQGTARRITTLMVASVLVVSIGGLSVGRADDSPLVPRVAPQKPVNSTIEPGYSQERLHVKFQEGTSVRLREGHFASLDHDDLEPLETVFARYPDTQIQRLFDARSESVLASEKQHVEEMSGREQGDKNLYYRLYLAGGTDAVAFLDDLNALGIVEIAYAEPEPAPLPQTPDYTGAQGYASPAPDGINVEYARAVPGGTGGNVAILDIEYSWNFSHEDLNLPLPGSFIANGIPWDPFSSSHHGTAVLGQLVAENNTFGVTGLAYDATALVVNAANLYLSRGRYDLANAIDLATASLDPGDVILIEQQTMGGEPVEWVPAFYDAIVWATSSGIIVVEAAGNGGADLDFAAYYGNPFPRGLPNSGAIIVGAGGAGGDAPPRARLGFSTFGSRVDLQGWGERVMTTGYGDLPPERPLDINEWYTSRFGGTSSASPIVASAAGILSSVVLQRGDPNGLSSQEVRIILASTGTPQAPPALGGGPVGGGNIGPLPNLRAALAGEPLRVPTGTNTNVWTVYVRVTFASVESPGELTIEAVEAASPPSGFRWIRGTQYDISTTAQYRGNPVTIAISYDPSDLEGADESSLRLVRQELGQWVDITTRVDTVNNLVYGETFSFSPFGLLSPEEPTPFPEPPIPVPASSDWSLVLLALVGCGLLGIGVRWHTHGHSS